MIKTGTIVWLKSGSPAMTVGELTSKDYYYCHWFDGSSVKKEIFHVDQLTTEEPE